MAVVDENCQDLDIPRPIEASTMSYSHVPTPLTFQTGRKRSRTTVDRENLASTTLLLLGQDCSMSSPTCYTPNTRSVRSSPFIRSIRSCLSNKEFGISQSPETSLSDDDAPHTGPPNAVHFPSVSQSIELFNTPLEDNGATLWRNRRITKRTRLHDIDRLTAGTSQDALLSPCSERSSVAESSPCSQSLALTVEQSYEILATSDGVALSGEHETFSGCDCDAQTTELDATSSLDTSSISLYSAILEMDPKSMFNWAFVCACNMNRSMAAHHIMQSRDFDMKRLRSYGTADAVRVPSRHGPASFDFGVEYDRIFQHLSGKTFYKSDGSVDAQVERDHHHRKLDDKWTEEVGLQDMLERNTKIKSAPEAWQRQSDMQAFLHDFVLCFDAPVFDAVVADLESRCSRLQKLHRQRDVEPVKEDVLNVSVDTEHDQIPEKDVAIILLQTRDNFVDAARAAERAGEFADAVCSAWSKYRDRKCRLNPVSTSVETPSIADLLATAVRSIGATEEFRCATITVPCADLHSTSGAVLSKDL